MSSPWAVLPPNTWGLPGAALLVDESYLSLEPTDLPTLGFIPLDYAVDHPHTLPTAEVLRVDLRPADGGAARLFKASETQQTPVDTWGLLRPTRPTRPAAEWEAREDLRPAVPGRLTVDQLQQSATQDGRLLVLTGDLGTFWSLVEGAGLPSPGEVTAGGLIAWVTQGAGGPSAPPGMPSRANARRRGRLGRLRHLLSGSVEVGH